MAEMQTMPLSKVDKLVAKSTVAARVRAYRTHPDVAALGIERVRTWSGALIWAGVVLGLAFTATNVQAFAAGSATTGSMAWLAAWLLDPMVSLVLVGVLLAEQVTSRFQLATPTWARRTKWFALAATYVMNTWQSWATLAPAGLVLHSVPPLLVFTAVEGGPALRDRLTDAVNLAAAATGKSAPADRADAEQAWFWTPEWQAGEREADTAIAGGNTTFHPDAESLLAAMNGPAVNGDTADADTVHEPPMPAVREHRTPTRRGTTRKPARRPAGRRKLRADFLADARTAWTPGTHVTPAWVREVTDCSRGMSSQVAADLKTALDTATPVNTLHAVNSEEVA